MSRPLFSVLHPSNRPNAWRKVYDAWMAACVDPSLVEYVLCVDHDGPFDGGTTMPGGPRAKLFGAQMIVRNSDRHCAVDAYAAAAKASTGHILICIADDLFPCEKWDERLTLSIPTVFEPTQDFDAQGRFVLDLSREFIIDVSTSTPPGRRIFEMPIVSRPRYERLGYLFYPEYLSMYADNDMFEHAERDGVIINARHLMFEHRHPFFDKSVEMDETYLHTNRPEAYEVGKRIFEARQRSGFTPSKCWRCSKELAGPGLIDAEFLCGECESLNATQPATRPMTENELIEAAMEMGKTGRVPTDPPKVVHLLLPGQTFSQHWVRNLTMIFTGLAKHGYACVPWFFHCSSVSVTRNVMAKNIIDYTKDGLLLWIDDDNLLDYPQALKLLQELEAHPEADIVAGWTWIQTDLLPLDAQASCGVFDEAGCMKKISSFTIDGAAELYEVEWTGFPAVAMRRETLVKAGKNCFTPLPTKDTDLGFGLYGEDVSFCLRLRENGGRIFVDPTVYVPHLKLREALPSSAPVPVANLGPTADTMAPVVFASEGNTCAPQVCTNGFSWRHTKENTYPYS